MNLLLILAVIILAAVGFVFWLRRKSAKDYRNVKRYKPLG